MTSKPAPPRKLISASDAAEILAVHPSTIRKLIAAGELAGYRVGPKVLRLDRSEVEAAARRVPTVGAAGRTSVA